MKKTNVKFLVELALLTAILVIMAYTPLGYLYIGVLPITLLVIPVAVGSVVLGPGAGVFLGFVFGLTSMLQPTGLAILVAVPVQSVITAIVPRLFVGLVPGLVFKALSKTKMKRPLVCSIACITAPITNTILYLACYVLCLGGYMAKVNPDVYGYFAEQSFIKCYGIILAAVSVNAIVEAATCFIIAAAISNVLLYTVNRSR